MGAASENVTQCLNRAVKMKTASEAKIICNFTTCFLSFQEEATEIPFCAFYFVFGACPPSLCKWLHTSKCTISNLLRAVTLVERTERSDLSDFTLMKIAQILCPELSLLQINACSHISVLIKEKCFIFFLHTHSVLVRHERKQQYSNVF